MTKTMTTDNKKEATTVKLPVQQFGTEPENFISKLEDWVRKMYGKGILLFDCETATRFVTELKYQFGEKNVTVRGERTIHITLPDGYLELEKKDFSINTVFFMLISYINTKNHNNYLLPTKVNLPQEICIASITESKENDMEFQRVQIGEASSCFENLKDWAIENTGRKFLVCTFYDINFITNVLQANGLAKKVEETKHNGIVYIDFADGKKIELQSMDLERDLRVYYLKSVRDENGKKFYQIPMKAKSWNDVQFLARNYK